MILTMSTQEMLRKSGLASELYDLGNIRRFSQAVISLHDPSYVQEAIREAMDEQMELGEEGRINLFIPCNLHKENSITPIAFQKFLVDFGNTRLQLGEDMTGNHIYGRRNSAYMGKTLKDALHEAFLVYDSGAGLLTDQINRDGDSLMDKTTRTSYNAFLEDKLGYSIAWKERALCEISG